MKKILSSILVFSMLCGYNVVKADTYEDYKVGTMPENMIPVDSNNSPMRTYIGKITRNNGGVQGTNLLTDKVWSDDAKMWSKSVLWAQKDVTENILHGFTGWNYKASVYEAGKSYVFRLKQVKRRTDAFSYMPNANDTEKVVDVTPADTEIRIGLALTNEIANGSTTTYSKEYGKEGMLLTDNYQEFKATIKASDNFNSSGTNAMVIGFPVGTKANAAIELGVNYADGVYIAEEVPYNIKNKKISSETTLTLENESKFEAEVLNQIGLTGYLNQDIEWNILNVNNEVVTDGFNIIEEGNVATVTVKETTRSGKYKIVATSKDYDMSKSVTIDVYVPKQEYRIYVDANGNDSNTGTKENPLKTLQGARDKVRALKNENPDYKYTVIFDEGTYYIDKKVSFDAIDSGVSDANITYMAEDGEKAIFKGSHQIDLTGAKAVIDDNVLKRLYPDVREKVKVIDLRAAGFPYELTNEPEQTLESGTMLSGFEYVDLYMDGNKQPIAQWPNGEGEYVKFSMPVSNKSFKYAENAPSRWANATDWWVGGYLSKDYMYSRYYVSEHNISRKTITVDEPSTTQFELGKTDISKRWKAFNLLEEIDVPGEWYIDRANMLLYYYMPEDAGNLEITTLKDFMLDIRNAENLEFKNIEFTQTRDTVVQMKDVKAITFDNCKFYDVSSHGIYMIGSKKAETDKNYWQRQNIDAAYDCRIENSVFYNVGGTAVCVDGGNVDTLKPGNNVVENNIFYNCAQEAKYSNTIIVNGCGNVVKNNNISKLPFQAIYTMGNDHKIQHNEIYEVCKEADDCGAIYSGRNTIARGVEVSYNYIHDLRAVEKYPLGHRPAIYWDDSQTGQYVHHNIIKNADIDIYTAGTDNRFEFNTSIDVDKSMYFKNGTAAPNTTENVEGFRGYIHNPELYYEKYENLQFIIENFGTEEIADLSVLKGNLGVNIGVTDIGDKVTQEANTSVTECNDFADSKNQDFRIVKGSEYDNGVLNTDFDIEEIGIVNSLEIPKSNFKNITPQNKEILTDYASVFFNWEDVYGASFYRIVISKDKELSDVVYDAEVPYNHTVVSNIPEKGKYYWKVVAVNSSREFAKEWESTVTEFTCGEDISVEKFEYSETDNNINITLKNETEEKIAATVYLAVYNKNGGLISVTLNPIDMVTEVNISTDIKKDEKSYKAVMYIWKSGNIPVTLKKTLYLN